MHAKAKSKPTKVKRKRRKRKRKTARIVTPGFSRSAGARWANPAEMRSLKAKRVREFAARTKKMPATQRKQARKAFKDKVDGRYREMAGKFPPARGLKDLPSVLQLISKLETVRMAT